MHGPSQAARYGCAAQDHVANAFIVISGLALDRPMAQSRPEIAGRPPVHGLQTTRDKVRPGCWISWQFPESAEVSVGLVGQAASVGVAFVEFNAALACPGKKTLGADWPHGPPLLKKALPSGHAGCNDGV